MKNPIHHKHLIVYDQLHHISARDVIDVGAEILVGRKFTASIVLQQRWGVGIFVKADVVDVWKEDTGKLLLEVRPVVWDGLQ